MCNPIAPPKTLKKNKNRIPIPNFTVLWAINRVGLTGAPINKSKTIKETIIVMTIVELNFSSPFLLFCLVHMIQKREKELIALIKPNC